MAELGFNYRLPDVQCALGLAQLKRLPAWVAARQKIAGWYDEALAGMAEATPLKTHKDRTNAYHLYVVRLADHIDRDQRLFAGCAPKASAPMSIMRRSICIPIIASWAISEGLAPRAEAVSRQILTLPMFPAMTARRCGAGGGGAGSRHGLNGTR